MGKSATLRPKSGIVHFKSNLPTLVFTEDTQMLVLSRKPAEAILIGNDIKITVLEVRGQRVRLGIAAPANVAIARSELSEFWVDAPASMVPAPVVEQTAVPVHA